MRAQNGIFDAWLPVVLRWCVRLGGPHVAPEDAAHDVMIVLLGRFDAIEHADRFSSWLFGVTRRVLRKHRGRAWIRRWTGAGIPDVGDPRQDPERDLAGSDLARQVRSILAELPERQREVLVLCDLEERTAPEVSQLLGVPLGTVASRLRLARARFERLAREHALDAHVAPTLEAP